MQEIIFASFNEYKTLEIRAILYDQYKLVNLSDIGFGGNIHEPFDTFKQNALHKVSTIAQIKPGTLILSEDSGLEIKALDGAPGVFSARYAIREGQQTQDQANIHRVLTEMAGKNERAARFVSTFCLMLPNKDIHFFTGHCHGQISTEPKGDNNFGYDPIFIPDGSLRSFAEMSLIEKGTYSHRQKAWNKLQEFLKNQLSII